MRQRILWASLHRRCDYLTEGLLCFVIVFSPWAFGATQPWAIRGVTLTCYAMGLLLVAKWAIRRLGQIQPARWTDGLTTRGAPSEAPRPQPRQWLVGVLAGLTVLLLGFCLVSALNPRAYYDHSVRVLHPVECWMWLPHSYDPVITWMVFGQYLAVACLFWSCRDWLLGKTRQDLTAEWIVSAEHDARHGRPPGSLHGLEAKPWADEPDAMEGRAPARPAVESGKRNSKSGNAGRSAPPREEKRHFVSVQASQELRPPSAVGQFTGSSAGLEAKPADHEPRHHRGFPRVPLFPSRLKRLLWVLSLNGALLATEGIIQRLDGTNKLLWLVQPKLNALSQGQFGPYAYRSNAAQYLNLVWPVSVGFCLLLRKHRRQAFPGNRPAFSSGSEVVLLPLIALMTAAPVVSSSRGGVLVALALWGACGLLVYWKLRRDHRWARLAVGAMFVGGICLGGYLGGAQLAARMKTILDKDPSVENRQVIYQNARLMAEEHPWFGTGPGTFSTLYQFYRDDPNQEWAVMAHNDWLETRVTFGWIGSILVGAVLLAVAAKWFIPGGIAISGVLAATIGISLGGCLLHAIFDFPFQILSILLLFTLLSSVLFSTTRCSEFRL